jgi:(E)-4-hydroxy-3-methylbut-2-enyl-diphosphate synthase
MYPLRRKTSTAQIGNLTLGGDSPIRIQSMTNTPTMDTDASAKQAIRIINAGGELVRLTTQRIKEAENLSNIREKLRKENYNTPIAADVHFNTKAAFVAATTADKVRINPGNFVNTARKTQTAEYTEQEYRLETQQIREHFVPFLNICKRHGAAIRIGVNHGSLSGRITSRYGNTPEGMVESCMEYLRICAEENFHNVVISMKASSTRIMTASVKRLVAVMDCENMTYPLHLGVTEAGDGEDGRIKSAVGIGTLLYEGIGDTIRISLSEPPEDEIPVARALLNHIYDGNTGASHEQPGGPNPLSATAIKAPRAGVPIVIADYSRVKHYTAHPHLLPDYIYLGDNQTVNLPDNIEKLEDYRFLGSRSLSAAQTEELRRAPATKIILTADNIYEQQTALLRLRSEGLPNPIVIHRRYTEPDPDVFRIKAAADCGHFFLHDLADGLFLEDATGRISPETVYGCSFGILQAAGSRTSRTEYISCPGCGRTLFDLHATLRRVKAATGHLTGLKIGIMGCIVNGPGEMLGVDYGYVGSGPGRVSLYLGKNCVKKNIPEQNAVEELLALIRKQDGGR